MAASRVLIVEDSAAIAEPVAVALRGHGYVAETRADGAELELDLARWAPDVIVLDVMLPGRGGFALLPVIRERSRAGVLMLTARDAAEDRVRGLTGGADDYLVKPFGMAELVARVQALLRRVGSGGGTVAVGDLEITDGGARVCRAGAELDLTATERRLLGYLADHVGRVVTKTQLLTGVWGYEGFDPNVVEVHVSGLRRKLEAYGPRLLHTVRGAGYRLGS